MNCVWFMCAFSLVFIFECDKNKRQNEKPNSVAISNSSSSRNVITYQENALKKEKLWQKIVRCEVDEERAREWG